MALEREFEYYQKNMAAIREKYLGKRVVIVGEQVIAVYDDLEEAYTETAKTYEPGTFMIHKIPKKIEDEVVQLSPFVF
jgi:molecular chaperone GrpE (heat shock protein)